MASVEIDNFVKKFKQLCFAGTSATLNVESINGIAIVSLRAEIDIKASLEVKPKSFGKFCSPAHSRRRVQRHVSRSVDPLSSNEAEQVLENYNEHENTLTRSVKPNIIDDDLVPDSEASVLMETTDDAKSQVDSVQSAEEVSSGLNANCLKIDDGNDLGQIAATESGSQSDIVLIYATASLNDSPHNKLDTACQNTIFEILDSKDHLKRNIVKGKVEKIKSRKEDDGKFKHEVDIILQVRTSSLWEPARTYIWKHLGNSSWKLQDGTEVSFVRIYRK